MSDSVISVENLSKKYLLTHLADKREQLFSDRLVNQLKKTGNLLARAFRPSPALEQTVEEFWALKDVSFEVKQGDRVGVIGRNGAGKSTLLKILSRITEPTGGQITMDGRVASLLEVGTGFHPDLSGRENIYLNGAILGMSRVEIKRKFDEIVAFAEVERFLDTPVKRYSSGMYVRLAFAVAAHLEPEILIVDEVLAVGDVHFQQKCLGKMEEVSTKEGRTVLFVSHNMDAVMRLCNSAILLKDGAIQSSGITDSVVNLYLRQDVSSVCSKSWLTSKAPGNDIVRLLEVYVHDRNGTVGSNFDIGSPVGVSMRFEVLVGGYLLTPAYNFLNSCNVNMFDSHDSTLEWRRNPKEAGTYTSTVWIPGNFLSEGLVVVGAAIVTSDPFDIHLHVKDVLAFNVINSFEEESARGDYTGPFPGVVRPLLKWDLKKID